MEIICNVEKDKLQIPKDKAMRILDVCKHYLSTHPNSLYYQRNQRIINRIKENEYIRLGKTLFNTFKRDIFIYHSYSSRYAPITVSSHNIDFYANQMFKGLIKGFDNVGTPNNIRNRIININYIRNISDKDTQRIRKWFNIAYILSINPSLPEHLGHKQYKFIWEYAYVHDCLDNTVRTYNITRGEASAMATEMMEAKINGHKSMIKRLFFDFINVQKILGVKHTVLKTIKNDFTQIFMTLYKMSNISTTNLLITLEADRNNYLGKPSNKVLARYQTKDTYISNNQNTSLSLNVIAKYLHLAFVGVVFHNKNQINNIYNKISVPSFMSKVSAIDNQTGVDLRSGISRFVMWLAKSKTSGIYNLKELMNYTKQLSNILNVDIINGFPIIVSKQTIIKNVYKLVNGLYFHPNSNEVVTVNYVIGLVNIIKGVNNEFTNLIKNEFYKLSYNSNHQPLRFSIFQSLFNITLYLGYSRPIFSDINSKLNLSYNERAYLLSDKK